MRVSLSLQKQIILNLWPTLLLMYIYKWSGRLCFKFFWIEIDQYLNLRANFSMTKRFKLTSLPSRLLFESFLTTHWLQSFMLHVKYLNSSTFYWYREMIWFSTEFPINFFGCLKEELFFESTSGFYFSKHSVRR